MDEPEGSLEVFFVHFSLLASMWFVSAWKFGEKMAAPWTEQLCHERMYPFKIWIV